MSLACSVECKLKWSCLVNLSAHDLQRKYLSRIHITINKTHSATKTGSNQKLSKVFKDMVASTISWVFFCATHGGSKRRCLSKLLPRGLWREIFLSATASY